MKKRIIVTTILAAALSTASMAHAAGARNVPTDPKVTKPIQAGQALPKITLKTAEGKPFDLNAAVAAKPTVLIFYRGGWCPYCSTHLGALQTIEPKLVELGYQIVAASADRPELVKEAKEKNELSYALYSDQDMTAAEALGLAFRVDDETYVKYKGYGLDLEEDSGRTHHLLPVPAAIVLDTKGVVRYVFADADYKVRVEPDVLLREAKAALRQMQ